MLRLVLRSARWQGRSITDVDSYALLTPHSLSLFAATADREPAVKALHALVYLAFTGNFRERVGVRQSR
jgi:hypothetical protein